MVATMSSGRVGRATYAHRKRRLGSLTHHIVQDLGKAIVTGRFSKDGAFPVESELCKRYDASRSIVREAIKVLNAKGLLIARPRRGTRVSPEEEWNLLDPDVLHWMLSRRFSLSLLRDFTRARLAIEPAAAAEAARSATEAQRQHMQDALAEMKLATLGKRDPVVADIEFHLAIVEASNNRFFYSMSPMIESALRSSIRYTNRQLKQRVASYEEHENLFQPIQDRDPEEAAAESRRVLLRNLSLMQ
jgi:DNA-binding FadR family transcriptional regulator